MYNFFSSNGLDQVWAFLPNYANKPLHLELCKWLCQIPSVGMGLFSFECDCFLLGKKGNRETRSTEIEE